MKVILQQDVKAQGKKGEMIEVSDGYARNFLLPRGLAVEATADNMNVMKQRERARQRQMAAEKAEAEEAAHRLESVVVRVSASAGASGKLFGSVTNKDIADALAAQEGIAIDKNKIVIPEPIKAFGSYEVKCKLGYEVTGTIHLIVTEK